MTNRKDVPISGIVTARNCPTCGHHEIGVVSENGVFRSLKPGTRVLVMDDDEATQTGAQKEEVHATCKTAEDRSQTLEGRFWIPEPLEGDRRMRLKYGVVISEPAGSVPMNAHIYESAYLKKLSFLIEKEVYVPIAVILDRFFVAPHLASGETRDVVTHMWEELEEIRRPVEQIKNWFDEPNEKTVQLLLQPGTMERLEKTPISDEDALAEQRALTLEEFLDLL